ncbi:hypothetical protein [Amycolatopsis jiangsuensis]|uniref:Asp-tRNA(Asn)/Glu-tRNA(Gln) amidotransferase A subunit family amidase n=1 Tax=Amycolatopsis jiangsuensis TaxID=1181879 RepID=A0A840IQ21_9PSEU|nr:hypothetical protein [Amycolatopsis jiangsuensis]MBB4684486.1 Asp-tRNA(Asn)/Glu-tRNA(Gln) amidotransferase A subunit family amidase [Amycolatopsis jiangsuensis]
MTKAATVFERDLGCPVEQAHPGWVDPFDTFWTVVMADTDLAGMRALLESYEMWQFMAEYDLLITPTLAVPPFTADGMPVGPQIAGRHLADAEVLRASAAFEAAAPWAASWPPLS